MAHLVRVDEVMTSDRAPHPRKRFRFLSKDEFLDLTLAEKRAYVRRAFLALDRVSATFAGRNRRRSDLRPL